MRFPFNPAQDGVGQSLVDLAMTRDGLVTIAVGPDVVVPASSEEPPARAGEPLLEIATLRGNSVHESGFMAMRGLGGLLSAGATRSRR
ncbi:MAG: hypothetical protein WC538_24740 [Thermoanaerobaculia bacterium]|jgi:hypothetical protein